MVLQWTAGGLKKRKRFEEAVNLAESSRRSSTSDVAKSPYTHSPTSGSESGPVLTRQVDTGSVLLEQIEVRCLESYLPPSGSVVLDVKSSWMWTIVDLSDQGRALTHSFAALSLARLGLVRNDQSK